MKKKRYSLIDIEKRLRDNDLPFSGVTALGSSQFTISQPAFHAGVAMHAASRVRPELIDALAVSPEDRYREEDPYTDLFIQDFPIQIKSMDSRFEYDVNRDFEHAIYDEHKKTWGLRIWRRELTDEERKESLAKHQEFHDLMDIITDYLLRQNKYAVIFDIHSYCYQRERLNLWYEDEKPEINVGTKAVNRARFGPLIDSFMNDLKIIDIDNRSIRVLENAIFNGGFLSRRLSAEYYDHLLVLALEFKKIFMDEWSGKLYNEPFRKLIEGFRRAVEHLQASEYFNA